MSDLAASNGPHDLPVGALIGDEVARVPAHASLLDVAAARTEREIGILAVGDGDLPDGVISERDIVRAVAEGRDLATTTAMDVAHTELRWVDPTATVGEVAREMMNNWVRHVLVGSGGSMVGIVSARDLIGVYASSDDEI